LDGIRKHTKGLNYEFEFIFEDDGSTDDTYRKICTFAKDIRGISAIKLARDFGKESAIKAGLYFSKGDAAIVMDADLLHSPSLKRILINEWERGAEIVDGVKKTRQKEGMVKRIMGTLFNRILNVLTNMEFRLNRGQVRKLINQFLCFSGVGIIGTLAHYFTLIGLVEIVSLKAVLASVIGFIVGAMVNYFLNYYITFKSTKSHHEAIIKFFTVALIGLILNTLIMALATEVFALYYLLAQVISTGLVLLWNFTGNRLWTFWGEDHAQ